MSKELQIELISSSVAGKQKSEASAEIATIFSESNGKPDIYFYEQRGNRLYSLQYKKFLDELDTDKKNKIIIQKMQDWTDNNSRGMAVWISPPDNENLSYKITTSTIWEGRSLKLVKNVARALDLTDKEALEFANLLTTYSINPLDELKSPDKLATKLIIIKDVNGALTMIEKTSLQKESWSQYKLTLRKAAAIVNDYNKNLSYVGFTQGIRSNMGSHPLSCDPKINSSEQSGFIDKYGSLIVECPSCHKKNIRAYNQLLPRCKYCGSDAIACGYKH